MTIGADPLLKELLDPLHALLVFDLGKCVLYGVDRVVICKIKFRRLLGLRVEVENMLYKRAMGYEYNEVKEEYEMGVLTKRTITKKTVVPDTSAQIFWLKNRKPTEWRDRREVDNTSAREKLDEVLGQIKGCE